MPRGKKNLVLLNRPVPFWRKEENIPRGKPTQHKKGNRGRPPQVSYSQLQLSGFSQDYFDGFNGEEFVDQPPPVDDELFYALASPTDRAHSPASSSSRLESGKSKSKNVKVGCFEADSVSGESSSIQDDLSVSNDDGQESVGDKQECTSDTEDCSLLV